MSLEKVREKICKHNAIVRRLNEAGFVYCSGVIFTGKSFNRETCTWQPDKQRIGELVWESGEWVVKPYEGFSDLLEGICISDQGEGGGGGEP